MGTVFSYFRPRVARVVMYILGQLLPRRTARRVVNMFSRTYRAPPPEAEQRCQKLARIRQYPVTAYDASFLTPYTTIYEHPDWLKGFEFGPEESEDKKSKGTVLLIHGFSGRGLQFYAFIPPLVEKGYRVIALDMPSSGGSPGKYANPVVFANGLEGFVRENDVVTIGTPDSPVDILNRFAQAIGVARTRASRYLKEELQRLISVPLDSATTSFLSQHLFTPLLVIHDTNDKEVPISDGHTIAESARREVERRKNGLRAVCANSDSKESSMMNDTFEFRYVETQGLGHKRILADKGVVDLVVA
ncbi:hypothetical protein HDU93_007117, partial [Gonapodya sp. JEL0774]